MYLYTTISQTFKLNTEGISHELLTVTETVEYYPTDGKCFLYRNKNHE